MTAEAIVNAFDARRSGANRWRAKCPVHKGRSLTLALYAEADRMMVTCFAGCAPDDIWAAAGLSWKDSFFRERAKLTAEQRARIEDKARLERLNREWGLAHLLSVVDPRKRNYWRAACRRVRNEARPLRWSLEPAIYIRDSYTPMMVRWVENDPARSEQWAARCVAETLRKRDAERSAITTEHEVPEDRSHRYFKIPAIT